MPLVTRFANRGDIFRQALEPGNWIDGDLWSDTTANILKLNISGTAADVGVSDQLFVDGSLTAGENLAINELVMVDSTDNEIFKATSAKAGQVVGVMAAAVSSGVDIDTSDMITYGIVTLIAGAAISIGDRLTADSGTAGRVIPLNTVTSATDHTHTAFTVSTTSENANNPTSQTNPVSQGAVGNLVDNDVFLGLVKSTVTGRGANSLTCTTSTDGLVTLTHGLVIAKALEAQASAGSTFKALLCLTG